VIRDLLRLELPIQACFSQQLVQSHHSQSDQGESQGNHNGVDQNLKQPQLRYIHERIRIHVRDCAAYQYKGEINSREDKP
jgi:hypothetical protein